LKKWEPKNDFDSMEKNGDGEITMQEFQKFNPQHAKVIKEKSSAGSFIALAKRNTFDLLDINHDNKISPEELNSWKDADTFSQLDTNHDGKLSAAELRSWRGVSALVFGQSGLATTEV